ncbi:FHS family L-fucose permease-like MFS transporter [Xanthomonas arboricola]|jgi:FHS family L-fucose permease-like MFS transporter|uniref:L-fucose:H+ symporter permease n=1 Tax=Xanthomonas euroxanthea TaxID=2259622 RepID=A0AA46CC05_9XANT|nr:MULTISPECIES: L-fucose:H+ symporter permease [Xanthomonas]PPT37145.1 L-fucose:H+ symporter permease [Xanthomonas arboricola]CAE1140060.1 L-fucose:H+ symporter permease [Xanthomonas euroxanthea]CAG2097246.1 L-fucose:H+ symporter permease [Xanthomonas euroxanthea]SUZ30108.1 L-fucose:H+ symporter permease [Xanthomonas euroxanthea]
MHHSDIAASPRGNLARTAMVPLLLIVSLFFLWGMANNLNDILIKQFKKAFELTDLQAGLVQSAFYLGYFVFAMPAAMFMRRYSYKAAVVLGLLLYACGAFLFYPAAQVHTYWLFLLALFVIASGLAFLETTANPLVTVLGPAEGAARRLNLAQAFNPLGSITGVLVGQHFIFSGVEHTPAELAAMTPAARAAFFATESAAVQTPYLVIGAVVVVWAILIALVRFPTGDAGPGEAAPRRARFSELLRNRLFVFSVVAQFFYVGAQVGIWSYLIRYLQDAVPGTPEKSAATYLTISLVLFMAGRFIGTALLRYLAPARLLASFATINLVLCAVAIAFPGWTGLYALVAASVFMSVMFPTIFALGLDGMHDDARKLGSSLLVMSIIGGALLTAVMGAVSDLAGIHWAMVVPGGCFAVILLFALRARRAAPVIAGAGA